MGHYYCGATCEAVTRPMYFRPSCRWDAFKRRRAAEMLRGDAVLLRRDLEDLDPTLRLTGWKIRLLKTD